MNIVAAVAAAAPPLRVSPSHGAAAASSMSCCYSRRAIAHGSAASVLIAATFPAALLLQPRAAAAAAKPAEEALWGPYKGRSSDELLALESASMLPDAGELLPNGVRVIDLVVGDGPRPSPGDRVYVQYKVWGSGFRDGPVADWTYFDGRPYGWTLGVPTDRIPPLVDAAVAAGMREGGWRRLIVPAAYGEAGLRRINYLKGGGRYTPPKAGFAIKPGAIAYFDLVLMDGGSGRCDELLRPKGMSEDEAEGQRTNFCLPGDVSRDGLRLV